MLTYFTTGPPTFALEFHLPYYAWRRALAVDTDNSDIQPQTNNMPRRSEEVIHLYKVTNDTDADGMKDYIHEAQISVMVTGLDDWFVR